MSMFLTRNGDNDGKAVIFAPEKGFDIKTFAELIVQVMCAANTGAQVWFPDDIVANLERDCTVEEIIDGYKNFLGKKIPLRHPVNQNKIGSVS